MLTPLFHGLFMTPAVTLDRWGKIHLYTLLHITTTITTFKKKHTKRDKMEDRVTVQHFCDAVEGYRMWNGCNFSGREYSCAQCKSFNKIRSICPRWKRWNCWLRGLNGVKIPNISKYWNFNDFLSYISTLLFMFLNLDFIFIFYFFLIKRATSFHIDTCIKNLSIFVQFEHIVTSYHKKHPDFAFLKI